MSATVDLSAAPLASTLTGAERLPALQGGLAAAILASQLATLAQSGMAPLASPAFTGSPTAPTPAAGDTSTKVATTAYVMSQIAATSLDKLTAAAATYSMGGNRLVNLGSGVNAGDAVTLAQLQSYTQQGAHSWDEVACVAASNIAVTAAPATIDGVTPATGARILLTGQTTASQNGVWVYGGSGAALSRPADFASSATVASGYYVFVGGGTVYGGAGFILSAPASVTVDSTAETWTQFTGAGEVIAGTGLSKTGNTLAVSYGTAAGTAAQGNDARITGALQATNALAELTAMAAAARGNLGLGSLAVQSASSVALTGGAITGTSYDGGAIGATTPSTGIFTALRANNTASIGTSATLAPLTIAKAQTATINEQVRLLNTYNGGTGEPGITFTNSAAADPLTDTSQTFSLSANVVGSAYLRGLYKGGSSALLELFRFTSGGQLLIGKPTSSTSAGAALEIGTVSAAGYCSAAITSPSTTGTGCAQLLLQTASQEYSIGLRGDTVYGPVQALNFRDETNNVTRMMIDSSGNFYVGSPGTLDIIGNKITGITFAAGIGTRMYASGVPLSLGTGTTNGFLNFLYNGNNVIGSVSNTTTSVAYNTTSDYRLKENLVPIGDAAALVMAIPVWRGNFKAEPELTHEMFLAHEVQAVMPHAIQGEKDAVDDDGKPVPQMIDHSKFAALHHAALQDLIARVVTLEAARAA